MTWIGRSWHLMRRHVVLLSMGLVAGVILTLGFQWSLEATSTESFCIACHEMRDYAYKGSQSTVHASNRTGIHVTCADCHEPRAFVAKVSRKLEAAREVYHTLLGTIDTPEKYAARQPLMAQRVQHQMQATDSAACRSCHRDTAMDLDQQSRMARQVHSKAFSAGTTCIQCHQGVGHATTTP
ncbi:MAG: NapC/NirT family cytochrome c [SAR86 cluster bacterium]